MRLGVDVGATAGGRLPPSSTLWAVCWQAVVGATRGADKGHGAGPRGAHVPCQPTEGAEGYGMNQARAVKGEPV